LDACLRVSKIKLLGRLVRIQPGEPVHGNIRCDDIDGVRPLASADRPPLLATTPDMAGNFVPSVVATNDTIPIRPDRAKLWAITPLRSSIG
jgi:hypothetical protein